MANHSAWALESELGSSMCMPACQIMQQREFANSFASALFLHHGLYHCAIALSCHANINGHAPCRLKTHKIPT